MIAMLPLNPQACVNVARESSCTIEPRQSNATLISRDLNLTGGALRRYLPFNRLNLVRDMINAAM